MKKSLPLTALLVGLCSGLFGSGGGLLALWALRRRGLPPKNAQATAMAFAWPCAAVSAVVYIWRGDLPDQWSWGAAGLCAGAILGMTWLIKMPSRWLGVLIAILFVYTGVRMAFF